MVRGNFFPNDTILWMSKFKASANDKFGVAEIKELSLKGQKTLLEKENCWLPTFSLFPTMFSKASDSGSLKVRIVW